MHNIWIVNIKSLKFEGEDFGLCPGSYCIVPGCIRKQILSFYQGHFLIYEYGTIIILNSQECFKYH